MGFTQTNSFGSGTKVRTIMSMEVPQWSTWDDDRGRVSTPIKRRLQSMFFKGDNRVSAEVMYVANETEREKLRRLGRVKVRIRDLSGASVIVTAENSKLAKRI